MTRGIVNPLYTKQPAYAHMAPTAPSMA
ncbi:uncharacterized protein G2W53_010444 [Senna tora]|uniref:Uncharacterized protein n=1 Tax=Senna tora TaxID=362788 RepID=A0A834X0P9_9FABA|nr:uncharacterized protein G2W53_010444 [Senna tora]